MVRLVRIGVNDDSETARAALHGRLMAIMVGCSSLCRSPSRRQCSLVAPRPAWIRIRASKVQWTVRARMSNKCAL